MFLCNSTSSNISVNELSFLTRYKRELVVTEHVLSWSSSSCALTLRTYKPRVQYQIGDKPMHMLSVCFSCSNKLPAVINRLTGDHLFCFIPRQVRRLKISFRFTPLNSHLSFRLRNLVTCPSRQHFIFCSSSQFYCKKMYTTWTWKRGATVAVLTWYVWGYEDAAARGVPPVTTLGRPVALWRRVRVRVRRVRVSIRRRVTLVQRRYRLLQVLLLLLLHLDHRLIRLLVTRIVLVHFLPRLCAKWKWNILREGTRQRGMPSHWSNHPKKLHCPQKPKFDRKYSHLWVFQSKIFSPHFKKIYIATKWGTFNGSKLCLRQNHIYKKLFQRNINRYETFTNHWDEINWTSLCVRLVTNMIFEKDLTWGKRSCDFFLRPVERPKLYFILYFYKPIFPPEFFFLNCFISISWEQKVVANINSILVSTSIFSFYFLALILKKRVLQSEIHTRNSSTRRRLYLAGVSLYRFRWRCTRAPGGWRAVVRRVEPRTPLPAPYSDPDSLCMYRTNSTTWTDIRTTQSSVTYQCVKNKANI